MTRGKYSQSSLQSICLGVGWVFGDCFIYHQPTSLHSSSPSTHMLGVNPCSHSIILILRSLSNDSWPLRRGQGRRNLLGSLPFYLSHRMTYLMQISMSYVIIAVVPRILFTAHEFWEMFPPKEQPIWDSGQHWDCLPFPTLEGSPGTLVIKGSDKSCIKAVEINFSQTLWSHILLFPVIPMILSWD